MASTVSSQVATVSANMVAIHGLWAEARQDTLGFESDLAAADVVVNWNKARDKLRSVGDELEGAQVSLDDIVFVVSMVENLSFFSSFGKLFTNPAEFFNVVTHVSGMVNIKGLADAAKEALEDVLDLVPKMQAVLLNIERLDGALNQLETLSPERVDDFLEVYNDFDGGDSAAVDAAFGKLEIFLDGLCAVDAAAPAAASCARLLVQVNTAKTFAVAGIDAAWAAADDMGRKARAEYERMRLDQLREELDALPDASPIADDSVAGAQKKARDYQMRFRNLDTTFRCTVVHQRAVRYEFATAFCVAQQYNFAGMVSNACSELFENGPIPSYAKLLGIPSSATPGTRTLETVTHRR
ncbi:hypothetical protein DIPPA_12312 [Diplonema papillatum]|nr:hypothetical protein DIPPA_12312 [Diplonema papillatum]